MKPNFYLITGRALGDWLLHSGLLQYFSGPRTQSFTTWEYIWKAIEANQLMIPRDISAESFWLVYYLLRTLGMHFEEKKRMSFKNEDKLEKADLLEWIMEGPATAFAAYRAKSGVMTFNKENIMKQIPSDGLRLQTENELLGLYIEKGGCE
jgi:hypothetical protein